MEIDTSFHGSDYMYDCVKMIDKYSSVEKKSQVAHQSFPSSMLISRLSYAV